MINSSEISDLRRDVARNARLLLQRCQELGLAVKVTSTLRDAEYQAILYAQGRTTPGEIVTNTKVPTFHGAGLAFDICQNRKGHEWETSFFEQVCAIAKPMGFEWGGDWKSIVDRPHFQWSGEQHEFSSKDVLAGLMPAEMRCEMTTDEARKILKEKAKIAAETIEFLNCYRYGDELLQKLAKAMI